MKSIAIPASAFNTPKMAEIPETSKMPEMAKIQGGDVKFALILNLHNFLTNLNFTAKSYQNMHLKVLNKFQRKGMSKMIFSQFGANAEVIYPLFSKRASLHKSTIDYLSIRLKYYYVKLV